MVTWGTLASINVGTRSPALQPAAPCAVSGHTAALPMSVMNSALHSIISSARKEVRWAPRSAYSIAKLIKEVMMASWLKCTARRGGGAIHINLENAVSVYWSERDKGTVIAFIGGEKDAVLVEERPEQILNGR
jgi:hypothetical protein